MMQPFPRKFYYEEQSYFGSHYLIDLNENDRLRLNVQETSPCIPFLNEPLSIATPTERQWQAFEKKLYSLGLESLSEEGICDGTWIDIWITFRKKVKRSVIESLLFNHWVRNQIEASLRIPDSGNPNLQIEAVQVWLGKASRLVQRREHHAKRVVEQRVGCIVGWRRNHAAG